MNERDVQNALIEILRFSLTAEKEGIVFENLTPDVLTSVLFEAKKHDLAQVVAKFIYDNKLVVSSQIREKLQKEQALILFRNELLKHTLSEITSAFNASKIKHIPLKGVVIRPFYPDESMRTSCDIDILVCENDVPSAIASLEVKGYCVKEKNYHDFSLTAPNNTHIELHFSIKENKDSLDAVLEEVWQYAEPSDGYTYGLKKEFFVFYMFAHTAYHFMSGGSGIKSLLDIWVMEHKMGAPFGVAKEFLERAGIYKFAEKMSDIANACFGFGQRDELSDLVIEYIFNGGTYGSAENSTAIKKTQTKTSLGYAVKRFFMPYKSMKTLYPVLGKAPYLLPFCWGVRGAQALFSGKSKKISAEMSSFRGVTEEKTAQINEIYSKLGLN